MNTFVKTIKPDKLSREFLKSLNGLMSLTDRELDLFSEVLDISMEMNKTKSKQKSVDTAQTRKELMARTNISKDNLSRYMKSYRDKGLIIKENGISSINKVLVPVIIGGKTIQITMILKLKEDEI